MTTEYIQTVYKDGYDFHYAYAPDDTISNIIHYTDVFVDVYFKEKVISVDLLEMLQKDPRIDWSSSIKNFIEARIQTDTLAYRYKAHNRPRRHSSSGKYKYRIKAYDAMREDKIHVEYTSMKTPSIRNDKKYKASLLDLAVTAPDTSHDNYLTTINGVFHRTLYYAGELYVLDGYSNMVNTNKSDVAIYDTSGIGGHSCISITRDMIENTNNDPLTQSAYISLPKGVDIKNTTPCLMLNGCFYAFENVIQPLSGTRLKIHMNKIDYIHDYLHNPNTPFFHDRDKDLVKNPYKEHPSLPKEPPVEDKIKHLLTALLPLEKRHTLDADVAFTDYEYTECEHGNRLRPSNEKLNFSTLDPDRDNFFKSYGYLPCRDQGPPPLTTVGTISHFLTSLYPNVLRPEDEHETNFIEYKRSEAAKYFSGIFPVIPYDFLCSQDFLTYLLTSPHTYLILLQNRDLYVEKTHFSPTGSPIVHTAYAEETPCGMLRTNHTKMYPYTITSSQSNHHFVYHGYKQKHDDVYKTIHDIYSVPSPIHDPRSYYKEKPVDMLNIFTACG